jgi:hypothetical protein
MVKLGQIDRLTFEKLVAEIGVGGDVASTHLIKGLDRKLLQRVKAGEDVMNPSQPNKEEQDEDDEFERVLEEKEKGVDIVAKKEKTKKGTASTPATPPAGRRMTRDEILKQLKASRATGTTVSQAPEPPASTLGARFKKIGGKYDKKRWIEKDEYGMRREILLTTDSEGKTKRKVRWLDKSGDHQQKNENGNLLVVDKSAKPLGMEVPTEILSKAKALPEEPEHEDIFEGVGADYNPLGDIGDDDDNDSSTSAESEGEAGRKDSLSVPGKESVNRTSPSRQEGDADSSALSQTPKPRDYFSTSTQDTPNLRDRSEPLSADPIVLAALKCVATTGESSASSRNVNDPVGGVDADPETLRRRKKFLEEVEKRDRQDAMDMDLGFGGSRFGDEDDDEEVWEERGSSNKRKRGAKKRKGDKDSVGDVMRVLEGRRKGEDKGKGK